MREITERSQSSTTAEGSEMTPEHQTSCIHWQGIEIEIHYTPNWCGLGYTAHLEVTAVAPKRTPLPITDTGYRSHFHPQGMVEAAGGPEAFVSGWLYDAATKFGWRRAEACNQQLSLF